MSILTIQPSNIDTFIDSENPGNFGDQTYLEMWSYGGFARRSLLKFDFSALPPGAVIMAAELGLYYYTYASGADPVGLTLWAYELTQTEWVELQATWSIYKTGSDWAAPGGDYTADNGASQVVPASYGWMSWNVLALCQHFQSVHNKIAHFLTAYIGADINKFPRFYSRRYVADPSLCPKLLITYSVPWGGIIMF